MGVSPHTTTTEGAGSGALAGATPVLATDQCVPPRTPSVGTAGGGAPARAATPSARPTSGNAGRAPPPPAISSSPPGLVHEVTVAPCKSRVAVAPVGWVRWMAGRPERVRIAEIAPSMPNSVLM